MLEHIGFRFACIGSREAPVAHCEVLESACVELMEMGAKGESGGAEGPDTALTNAIQRMINETGYNGQTFGTIHLPWNGFNQLKIGDLEGACILAEAVLGQDDLYLADIIARLSRGGFYGLSRGGKALHTRNVFQVLTLGLRQPVNVLITSAPFNNRGKVTGGSGTACAIANALEIPVINLQKPYGFEQLESLLIGLKNPPDHWTGKLTINTETPNTITFITEPPKE